MSELAIPPGFVLEQPNQPLAIPPGFVLEGAPEPQTRTDRFLTGMGDMPRGLMQLSVRSGSMDRGRGGWIDRLLRSSPEIAARMNAGEAALPRPTAASVDAGIQQREQQYQAGRAASGDTGTDWWRIGGQAAASIPAALLAGAPASLGGAIASGSMQGAAMGAMQPVADTTAEPFSDQKARQVVYGGAAGAAGGAAGHALGRILSPRPSANVSLLRRENVELTPGQTLGGWVQRTEDKAVSIPGLGDMIRNAQRRGVESFNRATANRVLREIGEEVPEGMPAGRAMVDHVAQRTSAAYDEALSRVQPFAPDAQFAQDLANAARTQFVTPARQARFFDYLRENVASRINGAQLDGRTFKDIDAVLGEQRRTAASMTNMGDREVGEFAEAIQTAFRDLLARSNPAAAPAVRAADAAHAVRVRFEGAAASSGAREGIFTPLQLNSAVRRADHSARHNAFARGDALVQDLSDAGAAVLPPTVPNSGSADRILAAMLASGGATAAYPVTWPAFAAGGAAAASYTRPGTQALGALLARQSYRAPQSIADALSASGGALTVPLAAALMAPPPPQLPQQRR